MSETQTLTAARNPTVYFIDDSATMREVIKIAFRKENIQVITCPDAASAIAQFGETAPDAVITDVIMPDKDGYEVCQFIKQHERFARTPVILMSGVVNRTVAEKATAVKADELIRKPFQPRDLIARVKGLLHLTPAVPANEGMAAGELESSSRPSNSLAGLFSTGPAAAPPMASMASRPGSASTQVATTAPRTAGLPPAAASPRVAAPAGADVQRLRNEIMRLELLVKKLQAELDAQHQYCAALEAHFKNLQEA
ncbi:MAG TPA: response regulator [Candidatus Acidoferrales bacterium]|jgi:CheY-like chemotaxis protein|nr:response regulator [Candidatus Acidoferrales bacterium]